MSKTTFYKDLTKGTNDLLDKDFGSESYGFEIESKAPNNTKFKTTGSRKADGSVAGLFEPSMTCPITGLNLKATIKTDKAYSVEASRDVVDGLKATVLGTTKGEDSSVKVTADYKNAKVGTLSSYLLYPLKGKKTSPSVGASFTTAYENFSVGASGEYQLGEKKGFSEYEAKILYTGSSFKFFGYYNHKNVAGVNYHHTVRPDVELVGDVSVDTANIGGESPKIKFAALWKRDADLTVKAKVESDAKLSLSFNQKLSPNTSVIIGSESSLVDSKSGHKVGALFKFNF